MNRVVLILLLPVLLYPATAHGQCYSHNYGAASYGYSAPSYSYSYPSYNYSYDYTPVVKKKVIHQDIVYTRYIAAIPLLDLPTYSAYYSAPPTQAAPSVAPSAAPQQAQAMAPATNAAPAGGCGDMTRVLNLLERMESRIARLEGGPPQQQQQNYAPQQPLAQAPVQPQTQPPTRQPQVQPQQQPHGRGPRLEEPQPQVQQQVQKVDLRVVAKQKCALCHEQGNESKGGDFVLTLKDGNIVKMTDAQLADLQDHVIRQTMPKMTAAAKSAGITPLTTEESEAYLDEAKRQRTANRSATK